MTRADATNPAHRWKAQEYPNAAMTKATIPNAAASSPGERRKRGSRRSPKRPAHQRPAAEAIPTTRRAPAAENSPDPEATARGTKVTTTPAAVVVMAKI